MEAGSAAPAVLKPGEDRRLAIIYVLLFLGRMADGVIDIAAIRGVVDQAGYEGFVETEIFSSYWSGKPENRILTTCAERMQTCC